MAFYFSRTAQNLLKRRGKVRNVSVFQKKTMYAFLTSSAVALFIPLLKRRGKVRNGSVFQKKLCMPS